MNNVFHERATSGFALSISTGLAMETLFTPRTEVYDPGRLAPPRISIQNYGCIWINVLTLIRNIFTSVESARLSFVTPQMLVEIVHQEIDQIRDLLRIEGNGVCTPIFYFSEYPNIFDGLSDIFRLRQDKTPLQKQTRFIYEQTKLIVSREDPNIRHFNERRTLGDNQHFHLIFSHITLDMLSYPMFRELELLESHTGKIKSRLEWNTKYHKLDDPVFDRLPFNRQLLYLFGDTATIVPTSITIRRQILELAKKQKWTPMTTDTRVSLDLQKHFAENTQLVKDLRRIGT